MEKYNDPDQVRLAQTMEENGLDPGHFPSMANFLADQAPRCVLACRKFEMAAIKLEHHLVEMGVQESDLHHSPQS